MYVFFIDLNLKILRDDSSCPGACQVIRWYVLVEFSYRCVFSVGTTDKLIVPSSVKTLSTAHLEHTLLIVQSNDSVVHCRMKGCFDALDKKYVSSLVAFLLQWE